MEEARLRAAVRQPPAAPDLAGLLSVELAGEGLGSLLQRGDALAPQRRLLPRLLGVVGDDQAQRLPGGFIDDLGLGLGGPGLEGSQNLLELAVAPARHRQDELQRLIARQPELAQLLDVVERQQSAVGHDDQPPDVRIAAQHLLQRRRERGRLGGVAGEDLVVDRQALGGLHHAEHELPGDEPLLRHAVPANVTRLLAQAFDADGGEVVEDHRQIVIDQRAQQAGHAVVDRLLVVHQRVHAAQQLLMRQLGRLDAGQADRLQPAQHAELGVGVAQAVEDHHAQGVLDGVGEAGAAEDGAQAIEAEFAPQLVECPDVAEREGGFEADLGRGGVVEGSALGAKQPPEQGVDLAAGLVDATQRRQGALAGAALLITEGLDELGVGCDRPSG